MKAGRKREAEGSDHR